MLVNLTEYFDSDGTARLSIPYGSDDFFDGFTHRKVVKSDPLELSITNMGEGKLELSGHITVTLADTCARCLTDVEVPVEASFVYTVVKPDGFHEPSDDEMIFMDGFNLDVPALINNELLMSLPMKVLCREDCKGLCPVCGTDLNHGSCGCDTFVPDPRMAAIMDVFNANKEV